MRIAMVSEHASPLACLGGVDAGGQNVHVAALSAALARRGHEVVVYTRREDPDVPASVRLVPGVRVEHIAAGPAEVIGKDELLPFMDGFGAELARRCLLRPPDLLHAHFWMSGLASLQAGAVLDLPVVQTFHALGKVKRRWQGSADTSPPERIGAERLIGRAADLVIATCTDEVRELRSMGVAASRVEVVPCGVDLDLFTPAEPVGPAGSAGSPSSAGSAGNRPFRLLILGRLVPRKGVADAIEALAGIPDAELLVVGGPAPDQLATDPEARRLLALAERLGVAGRLRLLGRQPHTELPAIMRGCDLLLAVPWYEPFGITPLEAMAVGLPVVATAVGGLRDTVLDTVTGRLVPPRRPDLLAQVVADLLADRPGRLAMAAAGRERALAHYGWDRIAEQTEACYRGVLARSAPAGSALAGSAPAGSLTAGSLTGNPLTDGSLTEVTVEVAR
ncbi:glycosyltransferase [Jatrophihabitans sp.]|uniref:glycosyltransferase n=1 Tax=Jatrophihabitans sp. TaxID=1932789 RepID=UPI002CE11C39|nr:glycosyltransferase [Jatrophihabitans sp.]